MAGPVRRIEAPTLWVLVSVVFAGLFGWFGGVVAAILILPDLSGVSFIALLHFPTASIAPAVLATAGVVFGLFVALLLLGRAHGLRRCPRCGTANRAETDRCSGCDLDLIPVG